jgi:expansin (peptidoglycan-binding protein)
MVRGRHGGRRVRWPWLGLGGVAVIIAVVVAVAAVGQAGGRACAATVSAGGTVSAGRTGAGTVSAGGTGAGTATHYVLSGTGNCSYPSPPADGLFVALSPSEYDGAAACGSYVDVTGPDGSVTAEVIDQCPPCATGHVDLSEAAFARIAPLSAGLVSVRYRTVADPALAGPISLRVKEGSSPYWLALLAQNTGNPLASVQVEGRSGGWQNLTRADYNYWLAASGAGPGPFTVRLTDSAGHQVTVPGIALEPGVVQDTGTPMYGAGAAAAPVAPAPATTASTPTPAPAARRPRAPVSTMASPPPTRTPAGQVLVTAPGPAAATPGC